MSGPLRALTDVRFRLWVTPYLVRWLYLGSVVVFGGLGAFGFLFFWSMAAWLGWPFAIMMGVSVLGALGGVLAVRVALEAVLIRFVPEHAKPWARPVPPAPRPEAQRPPAGPLAVQRPPAPPAPPPRPAPPRPAPPAGGRGLSPWP